MLSFKHKLSLIFSLRIMEGRPKTINSLLFIKYDVILDAVLLSNVYYDASISSCSTSLLIVIITTLFIKFSVLCHKKSQIVSIVCFVIKFGSLRRKGNNLCRG